MNRENKKRKYDKHYYRTHPCTDAFTCKVCGWPVVSAGAGTDHRNHCPNCLYSIHLDDNPMKLIALAMRPFAKPAIKPEEAQKLTRQMEGPY